LADDGKWYTLQEFQEFYPGDWERRFAAAPSNAERRWEPEMTDATPRDAEFFYVKNKSMGGADWNINMKPGWEGASLVKPERRFANDGSWYTAVEFEKFYPGNSEWWEKAPKENEMRTGGDGLEHDAEWFFKLFGDSGKNWTKGSRPGWDEAPFARYAGAFGA